MLGFRRVASQLCAVFASNCLLFALGSMLGYNIILVAELGKDGSEIATSLDQLTWIASLQLLGPIGMILNGLAAQRLGNRMVMFISMFGLIAAWLSFYFATTATMILVGRLLTAQLAIKVITSTYISEISEAQLRGQFLLSAQLAFSLGMFFCMLLGSFMHWRNIALANLAFPTVGALMMLLIPDSPIWLISREQLDRAEKSLCWLRGWSEPTNVQTELRYLVDSMTNVQASSDEEGRDKRSVNWYESSRQFLRPFLQRSFYLPLAVVFVLFFLYNCSGDFAIRSYAGLIFRMVNSPIDESVAIAIMGGIKVIGTFISVFVISRIGKRKLALFSLAVGAFCRTAVSVVTYFDFHLDYPWISLMALFFSLFTNALGIDSVVQMINTEIFPLSIRYIGATIGGSIDTVISSLVNKAFLYAVEAITLPGVFLFFAIANFVALLTYYFIVPETEGRSLKEIEDHFKGIKNLDDRQK